MEEELIAMLQEIGLTEEEAEIEANDFLCMTNKDSNLEELYVGCAGFAQVGSDDYWTKQRFEAKFLKNHIIEKLGKPPEGSWLVWKANPHDFGTYHDMVYMGNLGIKSHQRYYSRLEAIDYDSLTPLIKQAYDFANSSEREYTDEEIERDNEIFKLLE